MKQTHHLQNEMKYTLTLVGLIVFPLALTFIMWTLLPSGYQKSRGKEVETPSVSIWNPLQAGLKQVSVSFIN